MPVRFTPCAPLAYSIILRLPSLLSAKRADIRGELKEAAQPGTL